MTSRDAELSEVQQAFATLCLSPEPPDEALRRLHGEPDRWLVYRHMVRTRLAQMLQSGLRRTHRALGPARFAQDVAAYLAEHPPRTRYIREVVPAFVEYALSRWREAQEVPPHIMDLARFEAARWVVADAPEPVAPVVTDFDFDATPVLGDNHRLLALDHPVHRKLAKDATYAPEPTWLLVYRRPSGTKAEVMSINAVTFDLLQRWAQDEATAAESVRAVAAARRFAVDAKFLDGLCGVLADFLERGVLLGSRA